jgi:hypothetical protein
MARRRSRRSKLAVPLRTGRRDWLWGVAFGAIVLAIVASVLLVLNASNQELARPIEGVQCERGERLDYHVHVHLALFVEGQELPVPAGIGITDRCLYWLHTHSTDGIIHIEAPAPMDFTLGQFFAIWGQPLGPVSFLDKSVDDNHQLSAFVDGKPFEGDPATIKLVDREAIVIEYGPPFAPPP